MLKYKNYLKESLLDDGKLEIGDKVIYTNNSSPYRDYVNKICVITDYFDNNPQYPYIIKIDGDNNQRAIRVFNVLNRGIFFRPVPPTGERCVFKENCV